jgi:peptidoglycan/LPS O-acetylase OafA/YrhL
MAQLVARFVRNEEVGGSNPPGSTTMPLQHRSNNLDGLRLIAAISVLVGHAWPLTGRSGAPVVAGILLSHLAVFVFFSISGYLITTSWLSSPRVWGYLRRRVARIFPALIVVVLITVLVVGPAVSTLSPAEYFHEPQTWEYLASGVVLAPSYLLPGVFAHNPTTAVNGSLWSLGPEFVCYLLVLLVGVLTFVIAARWKTPVGAILFGAIGVVLAIAFWAVPDKAIHDSAPAMVFFVVGSLFARLGAGRLLPLWPIIPLAIAWGLIGLVSRDASVCAAWVALPYIALAIGLRGWPVLRRLGRFGDFSYGIYLWGFPIQQLIWLAVPRIPLAIDIVLVLGITGLVAIASWFLIEHRALEWARRGRVPPGVPRVLAR